MRLWSFHPKYLTKISRDILWRDGLKACKQLQAGRNLPSLTRFYAAPQPLQALCDYLHPLADLERRYHRGRIPLPRSASLLTVTAGQMELEVWLYASILAKDQGGGQKYIDFFGPPTHDPNPVFRIVKGAVETWEQSYHDDYATCPKCGNAVLDDGGKRVACKFCRSKETSIEGGYYERNWSNRL